MKKTKPSIFAINPAHIIYAEYRHVEEIKGQRVNQVERHVLEFHTITGKYANFEVESEEIGRKWVEDLQGAFANLTLKS